MEPLSPPEGSDLGERVVFEGADMCHPDGRLNPKKKIWEKLQVGVFFSNNVDLGGLMHI